MLNQKIKIYTESPEGRTMFCIVREFLQFFDLDYTLSVFEPESYMGTKYNYEGRVGIIKDLGVTKLDENSQDPILLQLMRIVKLNSSKIDVVNTENHKSNNIDKFSEHKETPNIIVDDNAALKALDTTFNLSNPHVAMDEINGTNSVSPSQVEITSNGCVVSPNNEKDDKTIGSMINELEKDEASEEEHSVISTEVQNNSDPLQLNHVLPKQKLLSDQNYLDLELSSPHLKESKSFPEKIKKSPQKSDRLKGKSSVTSLNDLPPIQTILPSLYNLEFKEKSNVKEHDRMLNVDDDVVDSYEEDFILSSDKDMPTHKSFSDKTNKASEIKVSEKLIVSDDTVTSEDVCDDNSDHSQSIS